MARANFETGTKECCRCRETKALDAFSPHKTTVDKLTPYCKLCQAKSARKWRKENPKKNRLNCQKHYRKHTTKIKAQQRRWAYGITEQQTAKLHQLQGGKCPGCQRFLNEVRACVDHDHSTGKVRGLLCAQCNSGIGLMKDSPAVLRRLALYLEKDLTPVVDSDTLSSDGTKAAQKESQPSTSMAA